MNDQQLWSLVGACAILMVPLGVMLGAIGRTARRWLRRCLPPRHLQRVARRRRLARRQG